MRYQFSSRLQRASVAVKRYSLVEDEAAQRQPAREFLASKGYTVIEATDGDDALRIAQNHTGRIGLMITDVIMPHMGGAQLAETLAAARPQMKVLFVSGYAENTILETARPTL
jgi:CheY-like chemotaxis protein